MKKTLIIYKPEYAGLAVELRDNYRAHGHEAADIVSEEEHDDIEYAEKMQYDEAVFIEDADTVIVYDIRSGYTNRALFSDVFYNDPKPDLHETITNRDTLNILADAISDVGSWHRWLIRDDMVQIQFCDIMLYDENIPETEPHSTDILVVRFRGNSFAVFLDDLKDDKWYERFPDDDSAIYPIETYNMAFDDAEEAGRMLNDYEHKTVIKDFNGPETLLTAKHLLYAGCDEVGFIVGGNEIEVIGRKGKYTEKEIETAYKKWCDYWKTYWKLRGTKDAYPKDYVCEISIPVRED